MKMGFGDRTDSLSEIATDREELGQGRRLQEEKNRDKVKWDPIA